LYTRRFYQNFLKATNETKALLKNKKDKPTKTYMAFSIIWENKKSLKLSTAKLSTR